MKIATFRVGDTERVGVVSDETIVDVSRAARTMLDIVSAGEAFLAEVAHVAQKGLRYRLDEVRLVAPIPRPPRNILCLGLNYMEHAAEANQSVSIPRNPIWFTKAVTSVCGPFDDISLDTSLSTQYDWEVELAVVVGKPGRRIAKHDALDHVHSYTVFNDVSVRDVQLQDGGQWFKGKSLDRSSPMGPWLVTADEIGDPHALALSCRINGAMKQESNTRRLIFDIPSCIADISQVLTLQPGDVISTGTPSGVGFARRPPEYLRPGDLMETEIEGIGVLRNRVVAA